MIRTLSALGLMLMATTTLASPQGDVLTTYADIAEAAYGDSLTTAQALQSAVSAFLAAPSDETLTSRATGLARRPRAVSADRGLPFRQSHRR